MLTPLIQAGLDEKPFDPAIPGRSVTYMDGVERALRTNADTHLAQQRGGTVAIQETGGREPDWGSAQSR